MEENRQSLGSFQTKILAYSQMSALGRYLRANSRTLESSYIGLISMDQITTEKDFLDGIQEYQEM
jgi:hypothetical protein